LALVTKPAHCFSKSLFVANGQLGREPFNLLFIQPIRLYHLEIIMQELSQQEIRSVGGGDSRVFNPSEREYIATLNRLISSINNNLPQRMVTRANFSTQ